MNRLSQASLSAVAARGITVPRYDRSNIQLGVVHFGPGAFHRVHQAFYFDQLLATDARWGICEVALQTTNVRDALAPQDGLYSLAILDSEPSLQVIGSALKCMVARESSEQVLQRLAAPTTRLITATITEKGYCLTPAGGLDMAHADIVHDLQHPSQPHSFIGYVAEALRRRHALQLAPPNVLSCDNLADNGGRLRRAVIEYASALDKQLATWIADHVSFPNTMVDSITPATDDALRANVTAQLGVTDAWPVQRESFTQWVIEDTLRGDAPDLASVGVAITNDVGGFERAKLRLLNGAHSSLAYLGLLAGHGTVAQAMTDVTLARFVERMMIDDIQPTLTAPRGLHLDDYRASLLRRFRNPMLQHRLAQIAWDGSQKLPFRILGTVSDRLAVAAPIDRLCLALAAWLHFIRRKTLANDAITDPLATQLAAIANACSGNAAHDVQQFLAVEKVFPPALASHPALQKALIKAYQQLAGVHSPADLHSALSS
jgi:fructuronate reductase